MYSNKKILQLLWPIFIETLLASTVGLFDVIMVGYVGSEAVSAVGLVDSINYVLMNFFIAISTGATVIVAQLVGKKDTKNLNKTIVQSIILTTSIALAISLFLLIFGSSLFSLIYPSVDPGIKEHGLVYMSVTATSFPFIAMFSVLSGIFRGNSDSKTPMIASIAVNVCDTVLNIVFIYIFKWGVFGAAFSTLLGRMTGALVLLFVLLKRNKKILVKENIKLSKKILMPVLGIGIPAGLDSLLFNSGKLIVQIFLATMGTAAITANVISTSLLVFTEMPGTAFYIGVVTIAGQCYGRGMYREAKANIFKCMYMAMSSLAILSLIVFWFLRFLISLYNPTELTAEYSFAINTMFLIATPLAWPSSFVLSAGLRSVGDVKYVTIISVLSIWITRVFGAWLLGVYFNMGVFGINLAMCLDWVIRGCFYIPRLITLKTLKKNSIVEIATDEQIPVLEVNADII